MSTKFIALAVGAFLIGAIAEHLTQKSKKEQDKGFNAHMDNFLEVKLSKSYLFLPLIMLAYLGSRMYFRYQVFIDRGETPDPVFLGLVAFTGILMLALFFNLFSEMARRVILNNDSITLINAGRSRKVINIPSIESVKYSPWTKSVVIKNKKDSIRALIYSNNFYAFMKHLSEHVPAEKLSLDKYWKKIES